MWRNIALVTAGGLLLLEIAARSRRALRRRRRYHEAQELFRSAPAVQRARALEGFVDTSPDNAVARYLLGCAYLRANQVALAARAFGLAHHGDPELGSAALLTFACLKSANGEPAEFIEQLIETWEEMKRPDPGQSPLERRVMECLATTTRDAPRLSALGRLAWLTSSPRHQVLIEQSRSESETNQPRWPALWASSADEPARS